MTDKSPSLLSVDQMSIRFGGLLAVSSMTFEVREGEVLSLIGPNGAGKTSAFNAITGYLQPSSGDVVYRGRKLNGLSPDAISRLGVVRSFQKTSLFGGLSAFENVLVGLHKRSTQTPLAIMLGLPRVKEDERRLEAAAREVLDFVGILPRAQEPAASLPYGEQRLLEVAIALAADPKLLLLDEPVSGMNPAEKASFVETISRIRERGITVLLVEQNAALALRLADRAYVLETGRVMLSGPAKELQANPEVHRAYLGG